MLELLYTGETSYVSDTSDIISLASSHFGLELSSRLEISLVTPQSDTGTIIPHSFEENEVHPIPEVTGSNFFLVDNQDSTSVSNFPVSQQNTTISDATENSDLVSSPLKLPTCKSCNQSFETGYDIIKHLYECQARKELLKPEAETKENSKEDFNENQLFSCKQCRAIFTSRPSLMQHCQSEHQDLDLNNCTTCGLRFSSRNLLENHSGLHDTRRPFRCHKCTAFPLCFQTRGHLSKHEFVEHHSQDSCKCKFCDKPFSNLADLQRHLHTMHTDSENPDLLHNNATEMKMTNDVPNNVPTVQISNPEKHHTSEQSKLQIKEANELVIDNIVKEGMNKHTAIEQLSNKLVLPKEGTNSMSDLFFSESYKCYNCGLAFEQKQLLKAHIGSVHPNTKSSKRSRPPYPFPCAQCSLQFLSKTFFERHVQVHDTDRPFKCDKCNFHFLNKTHMVRHDLTKHQQSKDYTCKLCQRPFALADRLKSHIRKVHKDFEYAKLLERKRRELENESSLKYLPYCCGICDMKFTKRKTIKSHIESEHKKDTTYECKLCYIECEKKSFLEIHMEIVHPVQYKDILASGRLFESSFSVNKNKKENVSFLPYQCGLCNTKFSTLTNLDDHFYQTHKELKKLFRKYTFECDLCKKKFWHKESIKTHVKIKHSNMSDPDPMKASMKPQISELFNLNFDNEEFLNSLLKETGIEQEVKGKEKDMSDLPKPMSNPSNPMSNLPKPMSNFSQPMSNQKQNFSCSYCQLTFNANIKLKKHCEKVHKSNCYQCKLCSLTFEAKQDLNKHWLTVHEHFTNSDIEEEFGQTENVNKNRNESKHRMNPKENKKKDSLEKFNSIHNENSLRYKANHMAIEQNEIQLKSFESSQENSEAKNVVNKNKLDNFKTTQIREEVSSDEEFERLKRKYSKPSNKRIFSSLEPNLSSHKQTHVNSASKKSKDESITQGHINPYACGICDKSFDVPFELSKHVQFDHLIC